MQRFTLADIDRFGCDLVRQVEHLTPDALMVVDGRPDPGFVLIGCVAIAHPKTLAELNRRLQALDIGLPPRRAPDLAAPVADASHSGREIP